MTDRGSVKGAGSAAGAERRFGAVIIGDELLSGKRKDKHFPKLVELLSMRGLELGWARIIGDDASLIEGTLRETFATGDVVFSFGGIGGTPDDRTRQCAAAALGLGLAVHPRAIAEMEAQFGPAITPLRQRMAEFPIGAEIIPNPVNRVSGFSIREHYFVPGFPNMAWPMIEWVLDTRYGSLQRPGTVVEQIITVWGARESDLTPLMERFVARYPQLRLSSLPRWGGGGTDYQLELGLRGAKVPVEEAMEALQREVSSLGFRWQAGARGED